MQVVSRLVRRGEFRYFITARPSRFRVHATYVTVIDRQVSTAVRSASSVISGVTTSLTHGQRRVSRKCET